MVRNKQFSFPNISADDQHCNGRGYHQCPLVNEKSVAEINANTLRIPNHLKCKSKNVIYMRFCKLSGEKETYFGRTIQTCRDTSSGHQGCFNREKLEKSALSMHAKEKHNDGLSINQRYFTNCSLGFRTVDSNRHSELLFKFLHFSTISL